MQQVFEIFWRFLALGCVSFGGPAAHMGYFQKTFVQRLNWLDDAAYARLVSLSQFLPGPGSSQVGFSIGLQRSGIAGGIAAFLGFTLPSFVLMYILAINAFGDTHSLWFDGAIDGLKLLAVVVVADATLSMFNTFCKEKGAMAMAIVTASALLLFPSIWTQMGVLLGAALIGFVMHTDETVPVVKSVGIKWGIVIVFAVLFVALPLLANFSAWFALASDFYHSGSLVFGGGHVVLPLLQQTVGDSVTPDSFLTGYAAAQAVPGPMFTFATFLGADMAESSPLLGAVVATLAIFLPGFLLVISLQGAWETLAANPKVAGAIWGINAAVVGLLMSALYQPVFTSGVIKPIDMVFVMIGFFLLRVLKAPILLLVLGFISVGILNTLLVVA
ncbi:chromate efflux transporter [Leucothrix arctica]|uniref:Chorismate-binding protein n=1 Tax=Leucothrix arctica TaxID=1481894 RepID=A0A317CHE2_9GAMM|nr:chromate efflux transporter [Leucothrix arctica]PWQ95710.1 chorismate-binding protein [Leucothrix arctica]